MCIMLQVNMSGFGRNVNEVAWRSTDSNVGRKRSYGTCIYVYYGIYLCFWKRHMIVLLWGRIEAGNNGIENGIACLTEIT